MWFFLSFFFFFFYMTLIWLNSTLLVAGSTGANGMNTDCCYSRVFFWLKAMIGPRETCIAAGRSYYSVYRAHWFKEHTSEFIIIYAQMSTNSTKRTHTVTHTATWAISHAVDTCALWLLSKWGLLGFGLAFSFQSKEMKRSETSSLWMQYNSAGCWTSARGVVVLMDDDSPAVTGLWFTPVKTHISQVSSLFYKSVSQLRLSHREIWGRGLLTGRQGQ